MKYAALIFDFDGLIVDTESPAFDAWSEIYRENGVELKLEEWVQVVGTTYSNFHPVDHLEKLTGQKHDKVALMTRKEKLKAEICETKPLMPGVLDRINEAKELGMKIAVVSTSERAWVVHHLSRFELQDAFDLFVTREDVEKVKPDPEPYLKACSQLDLAPKDCVVVEDSGNGVKAAKAAGATCFVIPNAITKVLDFPEADGRLASLEQLQLK